MYRILKQMALLLLVACISSCSSEDTPEQATDKVEKTFSRTNIQGAKSICYVSGLVQSRGFEGDGYYVVYPNGEMEPFCIYGADGKKHKIEIYSIENVGSLLFVHSNWEDCCDAIGKGSGKTEAEAHLYGNLFRQFIVNQNTGKVYMLPLELPGWGLNSDGAAVDSKGNVYAHCDDNLIAKVNISDMTIQTIACSTSGKLSFISDDFLLNYLDGYKSEVIVISTGEIQSLPEFLEHPFVYDDKTYFLNSKLPYFDFNAIVGLLPDGNELSFMPIGKVDRERGYGTNAINNPLRKTVVVFFTNREAYELNGTEFGTSPVMTANNNIAFNTLAYMASTNNVECFKIHNNSWYLIQGFNDYPRKFYRIDMNTYQTVEIYVNGFENYIISSIIETDEDFALYKCIRKRDGANVIVRIDFSGNLTELQESNTNGTILNLIPLN